MKRTVGFTLIEILVTTTIIMLISSLGLAAYNDFNNRQTLDGVASQIKNDLRQIRGWAMNGKKSSGCNGDLIGYQVTFDPNAHTYRVALLCPNPITINTFSYDTRITLSGDPTNVFVFAALDGSTNEEVTINLSLGARQGELTINSNGEIN
jgi:type II secretory pathway pseudopilin PulG